MEWLKLYTCVVDDPKVQRLPSDQFKLWINVLCVAREGDGQLPQIEDLAFRIRLDAQRLETELGLLYNVGLLDRLEDGSYTPHNWEERQPLADGAKVRQRRYRAKLKTLKAQDSVTSLVTSPLRLCGDVTAMRNGDVLEKSREEKSIRAEVIEHADPEGFIKELLRIWRDDRIATEDMIGAALLDALGVHPATEERFALILENAKDYLATPQVRGGVCLRVDRWVKGGTALRPRQAKTEEKSFDVQAYFKSMREGN